MHNTNTPKKQAHMQLIITKQTAKQIITP